MGGSAERGAGSATARDLLRDGNFVRFFAADVFAKVADNYFFVFLTWLALEQTGSPAYAGALLMSNAIPRLIFMIVGGSLADRVSPQVILRTGNIAQAGGLVVVLAQLVAGSLSLPVLFVVAVLFGFVDAFSTPASMSAVPRLVPDAALLKANSLLQGTEMATFMAGSLMAGGVLQVGSPVVATAVGLGLYVMAALLFCTVRLAFHTDNGPSGESELQRIWAGLRYGWTQPVVRANVLLLVATNVAVSGPASIGFLLLVSESLELPELYYSAIMVAFGVGALVGAVVAARKHDIARPGVLLIASYLLSGLGFIAIGLAGNVFAVIAIAALMGAAIGLTGAVNATWVQMATTRSMLGRVSALMVLASLAFDPFSQALSGFLAAWSVEGMFVVAGLFMIAATLAVVPSNRVLLRASGLSGTQPAPPSR
ncbi:MFS family permease [Nocardioides cavernae]|uniref:MFS family permease n=1 Tax=Nocardioides cavernae TaxID=1921566 RepID=A0A7Y9GZU2_9ACTN|nr:MFS transporter [Nocardioides cavernae]NYE35361.1 MFS family permease [Nocardioides cavernae]